MTFFLSLHEIMILCVTFPMRYKQYSILKPFWLEIFCLYAGNTLLKKVQLAQKKIYLILWIVSGKNQVFKKQYGFLSFSTQTFQEMGDHSTLN